MFIDFFCSLFDNPFLYSPRMMYSHTSILISLFIFILVLDLFIGDPVYKYHPVRLIGNLIYKWEKYFRAIFKVERVAGYFFLLAIILSSYLLTKGMLLILLKLDRTLLYAFSENDQVFINFFLEIHPFSFLFTIYIIYSSIAILDLKKSSNRVILALEQNNLKEARLQLSMIVGRETQNLCKEEIIRACIETLSESIVDGILSPIFYAFLGGAPLAILYRTVNTLDSMVGYKNEKYRYFGTASAKLDDLLNLIPARLSVFYISLASLLIRANSIAALKCGFRDGRKSPSPNSAFSESAVAGALGIRLGGQNTYHGKTVSKPFLGDLKKASTISDIHKTWSLSLVTSLLWTATGVVVLLIF